MKSLVPIAVTAIQFYTPFYATLYICDAMICVMDSTKHSSALFIISAFKITMELPRMTYLNRNSDSFVESLIHLVRFIKIYSHHYSYICFVFAITLLPAWMVLHILVSYCTF